MLIPQWFVISVFLGYLLLSFGRAEFNNKKPEINTKNQETIRINDLSEYR